MRDCIVKDLGRIGFPEADLLQKDLAEQRKAGAVPDHLLFLEHNHVLTMGRNGKRNHLLATEEVLDRAGVLFRHTDRGGDITYHGPGQVVAWPIFDLRDWKRDVGAYVRGLEQVVIDTLADFGIASGRVADCTGVWVGERKICAIGVHLSRWVTTHGLALNLTTDLSYFQFIIPCGLTKPVTSMEELGVKPERAQVVARLVHHFGRVYELQIRDLDTRPGPESNPSRTEAALFTESIA